MRSYSMMSGCIEMWRGDQGGSLCGMMSGRMMIERHDSLQPGSDMYICMGGSIGYISWRLRLGRTVWCELIIAVLLLLLKYPYALAGLRYRALEHCADGYSCLFEELGGG
jgi:hypothetical protein